MNDVPKVSIAVIGWNEADLLQHHLDDLDHLNLPYPTELVAVVGGSDGTYERYSAFCEENSRFERARCIEQSSDGGFKQAMFRALGEAGGDIILHLEVDTRVPQNWIKDCVDTLESVDVASCGLEPMDGHPLRYVNQVIEDRQSVSRGPPRLSSAQTIAFRSEVVDYLMEQDIPETLVDWHIYQVLLDSEHRIGRVDTDVEIQSADTWLSYRAFCQMQSNAVSEIDGQRNVLVQLGFHLGLLLLPPIVVLREWQTVREAASTDTDLWRLAPLYFLSRYVFAAARARMCLDRLLNGPRY